MTQQKPQDQPAPEAPDVEESATGGGLREQKKARARLAMHRAAVELAAERGTANVTAEEIAQRAGVSERTFFNYWPTKEAAVLGLNPGRREQVLSTLRERPAEEPITHALRAAMRAWLAGAISDPELRDLKQTVIERDPRLHHVSSGILASLQAELVEATAERLSPDDPGAQIDRALLVVHMGFAAVRTAFALAMRRGTDVVQEYERVLERIDAGEPLC